MRPGLIATLAGTVLLLLLLLRLAYLDHHGPAHTDVTLPGGEPATIYLPPVPGIDYPFYQSFAPPPDRRPPVVVLVHGFTADRQFMSALARRLTNNGFAVIAVDVHGHGENRNAFINDFQSDSTLVQDVRTAVDFARAYPLVDGSRIVVMGHSMGAGAVLDYAALDPKLKGAVMISGGFRLFGAERPRNALFIFAQRDPDFIPMVSKAIAAHLAGVAQIEQNKLYGSFANGDAVEAVQVARVDHVQIVSSIPATSTIVAWLDQAVGIHRTTAVNLKEPRIRTASIAGLLLMVLLIPLGRACGRIAPGWIERASGQGWINLSVLAGALLVTMPLMALGTPISFVPLVVGSVQVSWMAAASVIVVGFLAVSGRLEWPIFGDRVGATVLAAALGFAVVYFVENAIAVTLHRLSFTPERFVVWILCAILMLPFWTGFELLLRRGGLATSTILASCGRAIILLLTVFGAMVDVLPTVILLILPNLILIFVTIEIFAASAYSTSRNLALIAIAESMWFAWTLAAINPITFAF